MSHYDYQSEYFDSISGGKVSSSGEFSYIGA